MTGRKAIAMATTIKANCHFTDHQVPACFQFSTNLIFMEFLFGVYFLDHNNREVWLKHGVNSKLYHRHIRIKQCITNVIQPIRKPVADCYRARFIVEIDRDKAIQTGVMGVFSVYLLFSQSVFEYRHCPPSSLPVQPLRPRSQHHQ